MVNNDLKIEDRQPIIPLSLENLDLSKTKELIMDYTNNIVYIKLVDGSLFNVSESEASLEFIKQYLKDNPNLIFDVTIKTNGDVNGDGRTVQESIDYIYMIIDKFSKKEFRYAGSSSDGGPANSTNKVDHSIYIKSSDNAIDWFDGKESKKIDMVSIGFLKRSGGYIDGPMIPEGKFLLSKNVTYGFELPETGVEGQIFILLKEDI